MVPIGLVYSIHCPTEVAIKKMLTYIEAKTKILKQSGSGLNNIKDKKRQELKKKLFSTAADLMKTTPVNK
jgi:hypothetical protein